MPKVLYPQPFPFNHYDQNIGGFLPCGYTFGRYVQGTPTEMMNLYWRCKSFNVSGSFNNHPFNYPDTPPVYNSWYGTIISNAGSEIDLVCGTGLTESITKFGGINSATYNDFEFVGSDFYFNSEPDQTVKLYGNFDFYTDIDDQGGINTAISGSLSPFLINGFQVYEGGSAVNYNAVGLIENFSATFAAGDLWPYQA